MKNVGIISESRTDEQRTPLVPKHIKELLNRFQNLNITVQPSKVRCFSEQEYKDNGANISTNLNSCDVILGVKEIEPSVLIDSKSYIFFSHTTKIQADNSASAQGTPGMDKKKLINEITNKKITLIDYENIRDDKSRRYLGFGRFAGIIGCYNSLNLYLENLGQEPMQRAYKLESYEKLKESITNRDFKKAKIIITGDGRVAKGSLEFMKNTNIKQISPEDFLKKNYSSAVFCNLPTSKYVANKDGKKFDLQNFINYPQKYISIIEKYMIIADMLISSHYWDPKSPRLFTKKDIIKYKNLKVIGDITCDVNGSIPTTNRSTTIKDPYYYLDLKNFRETKKNSNCLSIMAIDNLPSELPKDSSTEFSEGVAKEVLPYLINKDDGRINKATIISNGKILPSYNYIKKLYS